MDKLKGALASRLYAKMHGKPRPPKNNDGAVADNEPSIDHVQENERTKRKVTPMTMLSPSRKQTRNEAQREEDCQYEKSTARRDDYEDYYTESSCESSDKKSSSGTYDQTKYDKTSDYKAQKQVASDFGGGQLASRRTFTPSAYGGQSTSDTDLGGYDLVPNYVLNNLIEEHEMGVFGEHNRGRKTHNINQRHPIRGREHAPVSPRRRYTDAFREQSNDNTDSGGLGDIDDVPQLTAEKCPSRRQRHERHGPTVIEDMIDQIPRADELAQEYRREDLAHEQHHYGVLASASVGNIVLTEAGRKQRTILFTSVDPDGMTHSHSFCDNKIETESKPCHGRYYIRTDTELEEFAAWGLQKPSTRPGSHATPYGEFGRRCDSHGNLVSIDNETIYCAPDRSSSKSKAFGSFSRTGEKNVSLEKDLAGSKGKANRRFDSAARTQRANSFEQKNGGESGYDADVNEGSHGLSKKSPGLFGFGSTADEQSFSSEYGQSSYATSDDSNDETMPPSIALFRSHGLTRTPKKASNGSCRRFDPEPLGSGPQTPSRMDHEQVQDRSSSFLRRAPAEVVNSMEVPVPRTPTSPSAGRNPRPLSGKNLFLGGNPYKKLLDRKINPRSKSSTLMSSKMSSRPAIDHVISQSAPCLSFLGDNPAADDTSGHGLAQSKKRKSSKKFQRNPLQFDPRNSEEVENFLIESTTPPTQKLPQQDVSNYSQGSVRSKASARSTSSKLTEDEALDIVIDTLFALDKPKNPFGVPNPPVAESSLPEESKHKPRRKSMLNRQLCWLSPADAEAHLRSRKGLSGEEVRDFGSASSLPFQLKREHSSKMRQTIPSIHPVDSFSSSMEIGSRGTVVSPATSAAMGPGQTSDSHRRISPSALHDLDTRINDPFLPERLNLRTPMETTNYILDSRRRASKLALHGRDTRLDGPLKRLNLRTPMKTMQIMDETQEGCLAGSTAKSLVPKRHGSLRQKVSSGLSRVANMMKIKVGEEDEGPPVPKSRSKENRAKPRKLSKQPKGKEIKRTSSGGFIKQEDGEEPSMLRKSSSMWSRMTSNFTRGPMGFDGANDNRGDYYSGHPRSVMEYNGPGDDGEDYFSRPRGSLGHGPNNGREDYSRRPPSVIGYDNANEDTYNSDDEYTEEAIDDYVTSDGEENVPLPPTPRPGSRSATKTQRPSAAASISISRSAGIHEHALPTQEVSRQERRAEAPQQLQSRVVKTEPQSPAPTRSAPLPPRIKVEEALSDNTIIPANTTTINPLVNNSIKSENDTSLIEPPLLKREPQVHKSSQGSSKTCKMEPYSAESKPRASTQTNKSGVDGAPQMASKEKISSSKSRTMEPYTAEYKRHVTPEIRTNGENDATQNASPGNVLSSRMDKICARVPLKSLGGKSAAQVAGENIAQSASEKQKGSAGSWQSWHAHHASKNKSSAPTSSRVSGEVAPGGSMYLGPPKPTRTQNPKLIDHGPALRFTEPDSDSKADPEQAMRLVPEPLEPLPEFYEKNDLIAIAKDKMPKVRPSNYDLWLSGLPKELRPDTPPPDIAQGYTQGGARQGVKPATQSTQKQQPIAPARIRLPRQTAEEADDLDERAPIFDPPKRVYRRAVSSHAFAMMEDVEVRPRSLSAPGDTARFLRIADQVSEEEKNAEKSARSDTESLQWLAICTEAAEETRDLVGVFVPEELVLPEDSITEEDHGLKYEGVADFFSMANEKASIARLNFIAAACHLDDARERWIRQRGESHNSSHNSPFPSFQDSIFSANPNITKDTARTFLTDFTSYQTTSFSAGPIIANRRAPTIARFFPEWTQHKSHIIKPHLLGIPSKIRYQIYGHLFAKDFSHPVLLSPFNTTKGFWPDDFLAAPNAFLGNFEGASLACHQLRDEVLAFYFTHFRFHITLNNLIVPSIAPKLYKCVPIFAHRIEHLTIELDFTKGAGDYRDGAACLPDGIDELRQLLEMVIEPMAKRETPIRTLQIMVRRYDGIRPSHQLQPRPDEYAQDGELSDGGDDFRWEISSEESSLGDYDYQSQLQNLKADSEEFGKPVVIYRELTQTPGKREALEQDEDQDEASDEEDEDSDEDQDEDSDEDEDEDQDEFDTTWTRLYGVPPDSDLSSTAGSTIESQPGTPRSVTPAPQEQGSMPEIPRSDSPLSSIHAARFGIWPGTPQAAMATPQPQRTQRRSVSEGLWKDMLKKRTNTNELMQSPEFSAHAQGKQPATPQFADLPNLARVERMSRVSSRPGTPNSADSAVPLTRSGRGKRVSFDEELSRHSGSFGRSSPSYQTGSPRFEDPPVGSMRVASPMEDLRESPPKKEIKPAKYLGGTPPPFPSFRKAPPNILVEKATRGSRALPKSQLESRIGSWLGQSEPPLSRISEEQFEFDRTLIDYENDDAQEMAKLLREQKYWDGADGDAQPLQDQPFHGYIEEDDDEGDSELRNEEMVIARVVEKFRRVHPGILPIELVVRDDQGRKRYIEAEPLPRKQPKPVEMFVPYMPHEATEILDILVDYLAPPDGPGVLTLRLSGFPEDYMHDVFKAIIGPDMILQEPVRSAWQKYIPKVGKARKASKLRAGGRVASDKQTPMMKTMRGFTTSVEVQPHVPHTPQVVQGTADEVIGLIVAEFLDAFREIRDLGKSRSEWFWPACENVLKLLEEISVTDPTAHDEIQKELLNYEIVPEVMMIAAKKSGAADDGGEDDGDGSELVVKKRRSATKSGGGKKKVMTKE